MVQWYALHGKDSHSQLVYIRTNIGQGGSQVMVCLCLSHLGFY